MFPLKKRKVAGYPFGKKTFYGTNHTGTDYAANYEEYFAPFTGTATEGYTDGGGKFWQLVTKDGHKFIGRHMSKILKTGQVREGELAAITGNSGKLTTNPHLHQEVYKNGKLVDPESINWGTAPKSVTTINIKAIANNFTWTALQDQLQKAHDWAYSWSGGQLLLEFDLIHTSFTNIPVDPQLLATDVNWYRTNITPLGRGKDATLLILNIEDRPGLAGRMNWADHGDPIRVEVAVQKDQGQQAINNLLTTLVLHELGHMFYWVSDRSDLDGQGSVHDYVTQNNLQGAYQTINYDALTSGITSRRALYKGLEMIVKKQGDGTLYLFGEGKLFPISVDYPTYQSQFGATPVAELSATEFAKYQVSTLKLKL